MDGTIGTTGTTDNTGNNQGVPESAANIVHVEDEAAVSMESDLRRAIYQIQSDDSLDPTSKARKMQELLTANWRQGRPASRNSMLSSSEGSVGEPDGPPTAGEAQPSVTYHSLQPTPILGCKHYMRNCSKWAECCSKWVSCRFCHDEVESHPYDRYATRRMLCMLCQTEQEASNRCTGCDKAMAQYYCAVCKFWDNDPQKQIYHCDKCKMCRIGRREEYVHCDRCNVCLVKDYAPRHKCFERSLECDCPICGEYLFTSLSPVMFMRCGHAIHFLCHQEHVKNSYQCPVCLKSLDDMQDYFVRIDSLLDAQPMPEEYAMVRSQILCNDCEGRSVTKFHFVYHKCSLCGSYNTKLLKTFNAEADAQADDPHHGQETNEQV